VFPEAALLSNTASLVILHHRECCRSVWIILLTSVPQSHRNCMEKCILARYRSTERYSFLQQLPLFLATDTRLRSRTKATLRFILEIDRILTTSGIRRAWTWQVEQMEGKWKSEEKKGWRNLPIIVLRFPRVCSKPSKPWRKREL
jgi:hypothetical protein